MTFPKAAFLKLLPVGDAATVATQVQMLAAERTERFVPANTATTVTLGNQAIPDFTMVWKNGLLLDDGAVTPAWSVKGKTVTLAVAANGTDVFLVRYHFRVGS